MTCIAQKIKFYTVRIFSVNVNKSVSHLLQKYSMENFGVFSAIPINVLTH